MDFDGKGQDLNQAISARQLTMAPTTEIWIIFQHPVYV